MSDETPAYFTEHGMVVGAMEVTCLFTHKGRACIRVKTDHGQVEIYSSPKGRSLKLYTRGCAEVENMETLKRA